MWIKCNASNECDHVGSAATIYKQLCWLESVPVGKFDKYGSSYSQQVLIIITFRVGDLERLAGN